MKKVVVLLVTAVTSMMLPVDRASGATIGAITITLMGTEQMSAGHSFPCLGPGPIVDVTKCALPAVTTTTPDLTVSGGHTRGWAFTTSVCVAAFSAGSDSPTTTTTGIGFCHLSLTGWITGSCGLAVGEATGTLTIVSTTGVVVSVTPSKWKIIKKAAKWVWRAVQAAWVAGEVTEMIGEGSSAPPPETTGPTPNNGCHNKSADTFESAGSVRWLGGP